MGAHTSIYMWFFEVLPSWNSGPLCECLIMKVFKLQPAVFHGPLMNPGWVTTSEASRDTNAFYLTLVVKEGRYVHQHTGESCSYQS